MPGNLRERLQQIRLLQQTKTPPPQSFPNPDHANGNSLPLGKELSSLGWVPVGHLTLRREISCGELVLPLVMPDAAWIVMPGTNAATAYQDLLFFDLETTGLSGGAGTLAFLAAFGRLHPAVGRPANGRMVLTGNAEPNLARYTLCVTQYLLLDYPGEYDFVQAMLGEFNTPVFADTVTVVTYNGKAFDSQILKTRCLMNGLAPPEYRHADLLHPARRLWKRLLPNCSQATIETAVFGIDRTGDIPGAMAPDIWFSFLKTGETGALMGICDHNRRDISGLAAIFGAMADIAADPVAAMEKTSFDAETLAVRWYKRDSQTGRGLLETSAQKGHPRAGLLLGQSLLKAGDHRSGRKWLTKTAKAGQPLAVQAAALRTLAIDSERRLKKTADAIALTERGLELLPDDIPLRREFERRLQRLKRRS